MTNKALHTAFLFAFTLLPLSLAGCGFSPIYSKHSTSSTHGYAVAAVLSQVDIGNIPDREGQILRNALIDRFYQDGRPDNHLYLLRVAPLKETLTDLDVTEDSDTTRAELYMTTTMSLIRRDTRDVLLERNLRSVTSYNILGSQFTTRISEQDAREAAIHDIARQIERQLSLYLKR